MNCAGCGHTMPDFGHDRCASCEYGPEFSASSAKARELVTARGARKPRETGAVLRQRSGSPRRLPTARELRDNGLDVVERGERRTRGEEVIRSVMLT